MWIMVGVIIICSLCVCGMCWRLCVYWDDRRRNRAWNSRLEAASSCPARQGQGRDDEDPMPPAAISSSIRVITIHPPSSSSPSQDPWGFSQEARLRGADQGTPSPPPTPPPPSYDSLFPDRPATNTQQQSTQQSDSKNSNIG